MGAFLLIGALVCSHPPSPFDTIIEETLFRKAATLAWIITQSGFARVQIPIGVAFVALAILSRTWRERAAYTVISMIGVHLVSDTFKTLFARARPVHWLFRHETSYAYPSGHAVTAIVVFATWSVFFWRSDLPDWLRRPAAVVLIAWAALLCWSRVALGVHCPTDVIGGCLPGGAWTCVGFALVPGLRSSLAS